MIPGFDSTFQIPTATLRQGLATLHKHARDPAWLLKRADKLARLLSGALNRDELYLEAVEALIAVEPFMLANHHVGRWAELLCEALRGAYMIRDTTVQAKLYALMGQGYTLKGDIGPARTVFEMIINRADEDPLPPLMADELKLVAYIGLFKTQTYLYTEEFAPEMVVRARALANRVNEDLLTANLYQALATVYAHRAETPLALGYGMTALGYWYRRNDPLEKGKSAQALAIAYSRSALLTQAEQAAKVAYDHILAAGNDQYTANICFQRGIIASQLGDWQAADEWLEEAFQRFNALDWQQQMAMVCRSIALNLIPQGRFDEAQQRLDHAALIWEREKNWYERAGVVATKGYLEAERGNIDAALDLYEWALELCEHIPEMAARDQLCQSIRADIERYTAIRFL